ncbi:MAG: hypothetical protein MUO23_08800 [Anaerolineales bacterium]|nr:hypothetical protein [Anaerolineales bacterium]
MPDQDVDRYRRIRDQQLQARDPLKKQRLVDREVAQKRRRLTPSFSFGLMWRDLTFKIRYSILGGVIGLMLFAIASLLLPGTWGVCVGGGLFPFALLLGFLVGRYEDSVENIRRDLH